MARSNMAAFSDVSLCSLVDRRIPTFQSCLFFPASGRLSTSGTEEAGTEYVDTKVAPSE